MKNNGRCLELEVKHMRVQCNCPMRTFTLRVDQSALSYYNAFSALTCRVKRFKQASESRFIDVWIWITGRIPKNNSSNDNSTTDN